MPNNERDFFQFRLPSWNLKFATLRKASFLMRYIGVQFRVTAYQVVAVVSILMATFAVSGEALAAAAIGSTGYSVQLVVSGQEAEFFTVDALEWRDDGRWLAPLQLTTTPHDGPILSWLQESLAAKNGAQVKRTIDLAVFESGQMIEGWRLAGARIVQVAFDDFDAASMAVWQYKVTIQAELAQPLSSPLVAKPVQLGLKQKALLQSQFKLGLGATALSKIHSIKGLNVKLDGSTPFVTATLSLGMPDYKTFSSWRSDIMRHAAVPAGTQDLVISLLEMNLRDVRGTLTLPSVALRRTTLPLLPTPTPVVPLFEASLTADALTLEFRGEPPVPVASPPPKPVVPTTALAVDVTQRATAASAQVNQYSTTVGSGTYVMSLTGIIGEAKLGVFTDAALTQPVTCISPNLENSTFRQPADCSFDTKGGTVYASVTGMGSVTSSYNLRVSPHFEAAPVAQGTQSSPVPIALNRPYGGTGGGDWSDNSYYSVDTTAATGDVVFSLTGLTGQQALDLNIFDNSTFTAPRLDNTVCFCAQFVTFAESCVLPAGKIYYLRVMTFKAGGPFTLMADSSAGTAAPTPKTAPPKVAPPAAVTNPGVTATP